MHELVQIDLPSGRTIWASVEIPPGPRDVGHRTHPRFTEVKGFTDSLEWVCTTVLDGVRRARPDQVSVEFGLAMELGRSGLVAALVGVGATGTVKVTLTWDGNGQAPQAATPAASGPAPSAVSR